MIRTSLIAAILLLSLGAWAQRILPKNIKWDYAIAAFGGPNYGTAHQTFTSPRNESASALMGYSLGARWMQAYTPFRRLELGGGFVQRNYQMIIPSQPGQLSDVDTIRTTFFNLYARLVFVAGRSDARVYLAPGLAFDTELNHPIINSNASGLGALLALGYEHRVGKWIIFAEAEARASALLHFKKEDYPWRHRTASVHLGLGYVLL